MNSVFYSPNMLQLSKKPLVTAFKGERMKKDNYDKCLDEIKGTINEDSVPEFGTFAPITVNMILENDNCLVFQVRSSKSDTSQKELTTSFANAKTAQIVSKTRLYSDKESLLKHINSIDKNDLQNTIEGFEADTNGR